MPLLHIIILALIQGITEFLPISSSGHLVLVHEALGQDSTAENLMLDIAVHVGTLAAVLLYFKADIRTLFIGLCKIKKGEVKAKEALLGYYIVIGSIPVILTGLALYLYEPHWLRSVEIVAWTTLLFGILLWAVDHYKPAEKTLDTLGWRDALLIGLAQMLALIPGTSRSGITMTTARYLGYTRTEAAHFSLLLSIVAISGAGTIGGIMLTKADNVAFTFDVVLAALLAFGAAWATIALMMKWLSRATFAPFAIYRIGLGLLLLGFIYL